MRILVSILFAWIFTLLWLLKFEWYLDVWTVNLVNADWTFDTNLSFIKQASDYIFYLPDLVFEFSRVYIKEQLSQYITLWNKDIYIFVMFLYHFIGIFVIAQILRVFVTYHQRLYAIITIIILYLAFISIVQNTITFFA